MFNFLCQRHRKWVKCLLQRKEYTPELLTGKGQCGYKPASLMKHKPTFCSFFYQYLIITKIYPVFAV